MSHVSQRHEIPRHHEHRLTHPSCMPSAPLRALPAAEAARRHQLQYPEHGQVSVVQLAVPADALASPGPGSPAFFPAFDEDHIIGGLPWQRVKQHLLAFVLTTCSLVPALPVLLASFLARRPSVGLDCIRCLLISSASAFRDVAAVAHGHEAAQV
jgi:hypothetical protein